MAKVKTVPVAPSGHVFVLANQFYIIVYCQCSLADYALRVLLCAKLKLLPAIYHSCHICHTTKQCVDTPGLVWKLYPPKTLDEQFENESCWVHIKANSWVLKRSAAISNRQHTFTSWAMCHLCDIIVIYGKTIIPNDYSSLRPNSSIHGYSHRSGFII